MSFGRPFFSNQSMLDAIFAHVFREFAYISAFSGNSWRFLEIFPGFSQIQTFGGALAPPPPTPVTQGILLFIRLWIENGRSPIAFATGRVRYNLSAFSTLGCVSTIYKSRICRNSFLVWKRFHSFGSGDRGHLCSYVRYIHISVIRIVKIIDIRTNPSIYPLELS